MNFTSCVHSLVFFCVCVFSSNFFVFSCFFFVFEWKDFPSLSVIYFRVVLFTYFLLLCNVCSSVCVGCCIHKYTLLKSKNWKKGQQLVLKRINGRWGGIGSCQKVHIKIWVIQCSLEENKGNYTHKCNIIAVRMIQGCG